MKIQGRKGQQIGTFGPLGAAPHSEEKPEVQEAAPAAGDQVNVTSTQEMRRLHSALAAMPEVRLEKVEELKDAIEEGSYFVESDKLARKVVNDVLSDSLLSKMEGGEL